MNERMKEFVFLRIEFIEKEPILYAEQNNVDLDAKTNNFEGIEATNKLVRRGLSKLFIEVSFGIAKYRTDSMNELLNIAQVQRVLVQVTRAKASKAVLKGVKA